MRINRSQPEKHFTLIPNAALRDERLSYTARGVLAELLSRPDGWDACADQMSDRARASGRTGHGEGRRAVRAAFAELEAAGYLRRERVRATGGKYATELFLTDAPSSNRDTASGTPVDEALTSDDAQTPSSGRHTAYEPSVTGTSNRRPSTKNEDGPKDLASRRARAERERAKRTVQSVIADVRIAVASVHGKEEANELEDGNALGLYYHYAHRKDVHDLVAYMVKILGDAPYLDTFIANAGWCCPSCQHWEGECRCAA